ncbi:MAG TPA: energy-coupling factor transporter transmembrane component T [Coriobacteriia bacterium]
MSVPVPFGQYVPGDSPVHRVDPRTKLGLALAFTVLVFSAHGWSAMAIAAIATLGVIAISGVPWRLAARGLVPILWLLVFTLVVNSLLWRPASAMLVVGPLGISGPGLARGMFFSSRIVLLVMGTSLVTLTTSPVALTDALSSLMRPLRIVRVPVDDVAMMFSIALRFIPTTAEEAEKIIVAQTARGAVFDEGGPVARARAWVPVLVPLFVNLFRRADDLAVAMESRCYTGEGRTRLHEPHMRAADWVLLVVGVTAALAAAILLS